MPAASEAVVIGAGDACREACAGVRRDGARHDALYPGARQA